MMNDRMMDLAIFKACGVKVVETANDFTVIEQNGVTIVRYYDWQSGEYKGYQAL